MCDASWEAQLGALWGFVLDYRGVAILCMN